MLTFFETHNKISWVITILGAGLIFYLSTLTFPKGLPSIHISSIIYHFTAFFLLAFFLLISSTKGKPRQEIFLIAIILAITYGALDELHQFFVPGRICTFFDFLIDSAGILFASLIYMIRIKLKNTSP